MNTADKKQISAFSSLGQGFKRTELEYFLEIAGLRWNKNNETVINKHKISFIKQCLREDLGISRDMKLELHWYDTGNAFSLATDANGNNTVQIELGRKKTIFQTGFNKKTCQFTGLYYQRNLVTVELLKALL